jgi:hypothetical protein
MKITPAWRPFIMVLVIVLLNLKSLQATMILIPMDPNQKNHLKAYGITYWVLSQNDEAWWLLNYKGGSFALNYKPEYEKECKTRGVSYSVIPNAQFNQILAEIANPEVNQDAIKLEVAPKVAVYTPEFDHTGARIQPWDDAVMLALTYAEIPYDKIYDEEVLNDKLAKYDWLHLHHEDFTGQYGRFYSGNHTQPWYRAHVQESESLAKRLGFKKVSQLKLAVVKRIHDYLLGGGFLFAMCSATDTYDIAMAADGVDICAEIFDGDPMDGDCQEKLDFSKTLAFKNFKLMKNPFDNEFSSIDNNGRKVNPTNDYFTLFDFSAKWDPVPTMLTQNHTRTVKGFMGQTTAFIKDYVKTDVLILGENKSANEVRYIHGTRGQGTWSFFGGHDPEDYRHFINDPDTDLNLHPNSPGYRLILNNILFPAAKKKERKT